MPVVEKIPETKQELLDLYVQKSLDGMLPSLGKYPWRTSTGCLYRGSKGEACLVGLVIKDNEYSEKMEGGGCNYIFTNFDIHLPSYATTYDMRELQAAHDGIACNWNHGLFVERLLNTNIFKGMTPSKGLSPTVHTL